MTSSDPSGASAAPVSADTHVVSEEVASYFNEAFGFVRHEREDVRKMAIQGIAEQSKDNKDLWAFLSSTKYGPSAVDALLQYLHVGGASVLGDLLTILINGSADGTCAEMFVQRHVVRKAMRLLDSLERSDQPDALRRSLEEMTLMLLNNLTASHLSAVDELLQREDEDMRGFYLGKLQVFYERLTPETPADADTSGAKDEAKGTEASAKATQAPQRDVRRWILHILLNLTRADDGQEMLLEDEDWRVTLVQCLKDTDHPQHRLLAAQCFRNCSAAQKPQFENLLKGKAPLAALERLGRPETREPIAQIQLCLAELVAGVLECEEGMAMLESVNAKRILSAAVESAKQHEKLLQTNSARVEEVNGNEGASASAALPMYNELSQETCEFLERHVLPYLDDIVDAYAAPGSDEID